MDKATYTKGPWVFTDEREICGEFWIQSEHPEVGGVSLAAVRPGCAEAEELGSAKANARLIASAPDLVEALQALRLQALQSSVNDPSNEWGAEALQMADAALSKALGEGQEDNG